MLVLYPEIKPYARHELAVDEPHVLYADESGSPDGLPVVFVHGGPGSGCDALSRRFFDPNLYRIVTFDQRGCGRSTPHASLEKNSTWELVADMERLREHLGIEKWVLFGGSWGSTLSLAYAQTHPERVHALILRGIFLCRPQDIHWFYQEGASRLFPDYWEDYVAPIPPEERGDLLAAFHKRLTGSDQIAQMHAAKAWSTWEGRTATLRPNPMVVDRFTEPGRALSISRIENHFFVNQGFLRPNQLLEDMHRIAHLPGVIVHGRYDAICPLDNAWALHQAWPNSELQIIRDAGHTASEPGIVDALVRATNEIGRRPARPAAGGRMKALLQRVGAARVEVGGEIVGSIDRGLLVLVGVEPEDGERCAAKMLHKLLNYRVFGDDEGKMNRSLLDVQGGLLLVSQFTLAANTRSGLRPSFSSAAPPAQGEAVFEHLVKLAREAYPQVATGRFGADMQVHLVNDGPVTFLLES
ncbi:proline iminopeptidase [Pseudomonas aeruginosa]|nr:proline iminopeptidase [Pseudomonas aeruginosa]